MDLEDLSRGEKVSVIGGVLTALGAFLPWVSASFMSVSGIDGDGVFTLVFGVLVVGIVAFRDWERIDAIATAVLGLLTVVVAGNTFSNVSGAAGEAAAEMFDVSPGTGLLLTLLGGLVVLAGGALGYNETGSESAASEPSLD